MSSANAGDHDENCGCPLCDPFGKRLLDRKRFVSVNPEAPRGWAVIDTNPQSIPGYVPKADFDEALALIDLTVSLTDSWECYSCERLANIDGHAPNCRLDAFLKKHGEKK